MVEKEEQAEDGDGDKEEERPLDLNLREKVESSGEIQLPVLPFYRVGRSSAATFSLNL